MFMLQELINKQVELILYLQLDHAELANHPLCKAYEALWATLDKNISKKKTDYSSLFDNEQRWDFYDEIKNAAGYILDHPEVGVPERS